MPLRLLDAVLHRTIFRYSFPGPSLMHPARASLFAVPESGIVMFLIAGSLELALSVVAYLAQL